MAFAYKGMSESEPAKSLEKGILHEKLTNV